MTRQFVFLPEPPAAPSLTSLRVFRALRARRRCNLRAESRTDIRPTLSDTRSRLQTKRNSRKGEIFLLHPLEGAALIARRASVAVRALPPVAMASRSVLRRGIAAFAEATRGGAAGHARARQGGVTGPGTTRLRDKVHGSAHRGRPNRRRARPVAATPARDPRRVASRDRRLGGRARTIACRSRAPRPSRSRADDRRIFCSFAHRRASAPLAPARERTAGPSLSGGAFRVFFGVPKKTSRLRRVSRPTALKPRRDVPFAHHRLSPVRLSHPVRTHTSHHQSQTSPDAPFLCHAARVADGAPRAFAPSRAAADAADLPAHQSAVPQLVA